MNELNSLNKIIILYDGDVILEMSVIVVAVVMLIVHY